MLAAVFTAMYVPVLTDLGQEWWTDDTTSYGVVVPPLAGYFAWLKRRQVQALPAVIEPWGLGVLVTGSALFVVGSISAGTFLARCSLIVVLAGILLTFWGRRRVRLLLFPLLLLATMIPLPTVVSNTLGLQLQMLASRSAATILTFVSIPVYQEGNVLLLKGATIGVAEGCSGLHSLYSLLVFALLIGFTRCGTLWSRSLCFASAVPIAIAVNVLRVTCTAFIASYRPDWALQFFHMFSAFAVFLTECGVLIFVANSVTLVLDRQLCSRH